MYTCTINGLFHDSPGSCFVMNAIFILFTCMNPPGGIGVHRHVASWRPRVPRPETEWKLWFRIRPCHVRWLHGSGVVQRVDSCASTPGDGCPDYLVCWLRDTVSHKYCDFLSLASHFFKGWSNEESLIALSHPCTYRTFCALLMCIYSVLLSVFYTSDLTITMFNCSNCTLMFYTFKFLLFLSCVSVRVREQRWARSMSTHVW